MEFGVLLKAVKKLLDAPRDHDGATNLLAWDAGVRPWVDALLPPALKVHCADVLADFFAGKWSGEKEKPYENLAAMCTKFGLPPRGVAIRHVSSQPHVFHSTAGGTPVGAIFRHGLFFNARKVFELPRHLRTAERWDDLVELCLANYEFLLAKMSIAPYSEVLADFKVVLPESTEEVFQSLVDALHGVALAVCYFCCLAHL
jgi:hypothetical protein